VGRLTTAYAQAKNKRRRIKKRAVRSSTGAKRLLNVLLFLLLLRGGGDDDDELNIRAQIDGVAAKKSHSGVPHCNYRVNRDLLLVHHVLGPGVEGGEIGVCEVKASGVVRWATIIYRD
jgi:hypothetical protein